MATLLEIQLPAGYTALNNGGPKFQNTRIGKPGRWQINADDPFAVWEFAVSYLRSHWEEAEAHQLDEIYNFFLVTGAAYAFLVHDPMDYTASMMGGAGIVKELNGVFRLHKRYVFGGLIYDHPITRPESDVALNGSASSGTIGARGIVSGIGSPTSGQAKGGWTGSFLRPMVFAENGLSYDVSNEGTIQAFNVALQEQLEF